MLSEIRDGVRTYWVNPETENYHLLEVNQGPMRRIKKQTKKLFKNNGAFLLFVLVSIILLLTLAGILVILSSPTKTSQEAFHGGNPVSIQKEDLKALKFTADPSTPTYMPETTTAEPTTIITEHYTETPTQTTTSSTEMPTSTEPTTILAPTTTTTSTEPTTTTTEPITTTTSTEPTTTVKPTRPKRPIKYVTGVMKLGFDVPYKTFKHNITAGNN